MRIMPASNVVAWILLDQKAVCSTDKVSLPSP